ncbi:MAG: LysM peptidoglycan-binding domain-containing protein [Candidatus Krumholzibacteria bacterium]|nr:LysM peptidoglycan-binding domain-containing protein [Candidatus Krumholzibacteria bacterium]
MTRTMRQLGMVLGVSAAVAAMLGSTGCSRSSGRHVDVTAGEYYSEEEYEALTRKEKETYCVALGQELGQLQGQVEANRDELETTRRQIESLRNQIAPVERELLRVESDIRALSSEIAYYESLPASWTIKSGECLWIIAGYEEIYADPIKWPRIHRANTDKIDDPEWIYPDTVLVIPRHWPRQHRVVMDESLSIIASYWEVYGNPMNWTRLFEANKDEVFDPDLILPEQVLQIPR